MFNWFKKKEPELPEVKHSMWEPPEEVLDMSSDELFLWLMGDGTIFESEYLRFIEQYTPFIYSVGLQVPLYSVLVLWYAIQQYKKEKDL